MPRQKRPSARVTGGREARAIAANLARALFATRKRRRWTQDRLADAVGVSQTEISHLERGYGARTSIETWVAIGIALDRPIAIGFGRDVVEPLSDAGHLAAQELLLRLAVGGGWSGRFEAPSDPRDPRHATDVVLTRATGEHVLVEIWNRLDDLGAAIRSSDRKAAEAGANGRAVQVLWLLVDTHANRAIVRRFPAILRARFHGSSAGWVRALVGDWRAPTKPGLAWIDVRSGTVRELRLRAG